jgi:Mn2+/Fe2+ NRAMP family transporter
MMLVAIFGTTISPYLFFWQASQEAEDQHVDADAKPLKRHPLRRGPSFNEYALILLREWRSQI